MTDYRSEPSIGARIKATRRQRGFRTTKDLADAMPGSKITASILENIESGRKPDLHVSQLLNIARALHIPPSYLLAPMGRPQSPVDLPNLSEDLAQMPAIEFDSWFSAIPGSSYRAPIAAERIDIEELNILRELSILHRERARVELVERAQRESGDPELEAISSGALDRISRLDSEIAQLERALDASGWALQTPSSV